MSRFSRQAQRIENDWLRSLRAAAKDRLTPQAPLAAAIDSRTRVEAVLNTRRRRSKRSASAKQPPSG